MNRAFSPATTEIYTHVIRQPGFGVRNPLI